MSTITDKLRAAQTIVDKRGIDLVAARHVFKSLHPQVSGTWAIDTGLLLEVAIISELVAPFTRDSIAKQLAETSGAFPWDGPVGNGLTVREYQSRFGEIADEKLFLGKQLGLIEVSS